MTKLKFERGVRFLYILVPEDLMARIDEQVRLARADRPWESMHRDAFARLAVAEYLDLVERRQRGTT